MCLLQGGQTVPSAACSGVDISVAENIGHCCETSSFLKSVDSNKYLWPAAVPRPTIYSLI